MVLLYLLFGFRIEEVGFLQVHPDPDRLSVPRRTFRRETGYKGTFTQLQVNVNGFSYRLNDLDDRLKTVR
jgi:hypothetical protein